MSLFMLLQHGIQFLYEWDGEGSDLLFSQGVESALIYAAKDLLSISAVRGVRVDGWIGVKGENTVAEQGQLSTVPL